MRKLRTRWWRKTDKDFIQVWPPWRLNTYVPRLIVLIWDVMCSLTCSLEDPYPSLYIVKGQSYIYNIIFGTISFCSLAVHANQRCAPHVFVLWAEPPTMVRPISTHEVIEIYTPTRDLCAFYLANNTTMRWWRSNEDLLPLFQNNCRCRFKKITLIKYIY